MTFNTQPYYDVEVKVHDAKDDDEAVNLGQLKEYAAQALQYKGTKTPSDAAPTNQEVGDVWVFSQAGDLTVNSWVGLQQGTKIQLHEAVFWDGHTWDLLGPVTTGGTSVIDVDKISTSKIVIDKRTNGPEHPLIGVDLSDVNGHIANNAGKITQNLDQISKNTSAIAANKAVSDLNQKSINQDITDIKANKDLLDQRVNSLITDIQGDRDDIAKNKNDIGSLTTTVNGLSLQLPVDIASTSQLGIMQVGNGLSVSNGVVSVDPKGVFTFKGEIKDVSIAPPSQNNAGDVYLINNPNNEMQNAGYKGLPSSHRLLTGELIVWDGNAWSILGGSAVSGVSSVTAEYNSSGNNAITTNGKNNVIVGVKTATDSHYGVVKIATPQEISNPSLADPATVAHVGATSLLYTEVGNNRTKIDGNTTKINGVDSIAQGNARDIAANQQKIADNISELQSLDNDVNNLESKVLPATDHSTGVVSIDPQSPLTVDNAGKLSLSLGNVLNYQGVTVVGTAPQTPSRGDVWVLFADGTFDASWGSPLAGKQGFAQEMVIWNGNYWKAIGPVQQGTLTSVRPGRALEAKIVNGELLINAKLGTDSQEGVVRIATDLEIKAGTSTAEVINVKQLHDAVAALTSEDTKLNAEISKLSPSVADNTAQNKTHAADIAALETKADSNSQEIKIAEGLIGVNRNNLNQIFPPGSNNVGRVLRASTDKTVGWDKFIGTSGEELDATTSSTPRKYGTIRDYRGKIQGFAGPAQIVRPAIWVTPDNRTVANAAQRRDFEIINEGLITRPAGNDSIQSTHTVAPVADPIAQGQKMGPVAITIPITGVWTAGTNALDAAKQNYHHFMIEYMLNTSDLLVFYDFVYKAVGTGGNEELVSLRGTINIKGDHDSYSGICVQGFTDRYYQVRAYN